MFRIAHLLLKISSALSALLLFLPAAGPARCICKDPPAIGDRYRGKAKSDPAEDKKPQEMTAARIARWKPPAAKLTEESPRQPGHEMENFRISGWLTSVRFNGECSYVLTLADSKKKDAPTVQAVIPDSQKSARTALLKALKTAEVQMNCGNRENALPEPLHVTIEGSGFYSGPHTATDGDSPPEGKKPNATPRPAKHVGWRICPVTQLEITEGESGGKSEGKRQKAENKSETD